MGIGSHTEPIKGATDSWITPKFIIDALGPFELDPCQCTPQPWNCARCHYLIDDDGLNAPWFGRIWLNPPYSQIGKWMAKMADHGCGTALVFARTETAWFVESVWKRASGIMFLHGRLTFHKPDGTKGRGNSGGPSCLVSYGNEDFTKLISSGLNGTVVPVNQGVA